MNVMFVALSKVAFSDILERVILKMFLVILFACFTFFNFAQKELCITSALNFSVIKFCSFTYF